MLDANAKKKIIEKFKTHDQDTGSAQVQIAILTTEIKSLTDHLKMHKKDYSSRRGLLQMVNDRRKLLAYLRREMPKEYAKLIEKLKM